MLLVIFGAGASYDSVFDLRPGPVLPALRRLVDSNPENERPPLANQLFDIRPIFVDAVGRFPQIRPLVNLLRNEGIVIEQELARLQRQKFHERPRQLAAIRYYLHFAIWECQRLWHQRHRGVTNYVTLLDDIERWRVEFDERVCFVTFNYDTILDQTMQELLHFDIANVDSYVSQENYKLVKLHGSINWGREVDVDGDLAQYGRERLINDAEELRERISNRYRLVVNHPMWIEDGKLVFPALSIPVENKDEFSCPKAHVEALERLLPRVTKVLIVGWRATEADFLNLLCSKLPKSLDLMIVSGDKGGADETLANLKNFGRSHELELLKLSEVITFGAQTIPVCRVAHPITDGFTGLISKLGLLEAFFHDTAVAARVN